jgi:hypothetical protein
MYILNFETTLKCSLFVTGDFQRWVLRTGLSWLQKETVALSPTSLGIYIKESIWHDRKKYTCKFLLQNVQWFCLKATSINCYPDWKQMKCTNWIIKKRLIIELLRVQTGLKHTDNGKDGDLSQKISSMDPLHLKLDWTTKEKT